MSYTMTFDASHKVGRGSGHARSFFRHIARDADIAAGFEFTHANPNIVTERTRLNFTQVNDGAGGFRALESVDGAPPSQEFESYLDGRLQTVTKSLRKDAVLIRGIILQLDPKWFDDHNPDWRERGVNRVAVDNMNASLEWACEEFGQQNIVGFSIHMDEYHPQLQVLVTPVTEDGRLAQKDFFRNPLDMKRQHTELRRHMDAAGYEVEHRVTERSREHLSSSEYAAKADRLRDAIQDADDDKATYETLSVSLANRKTNLDGRESGIARREVEVAAAYAEARRLGQAADAARNSAVAAGLSAQQAAIEAETEREELRTAKARLETIPPDVDRWLDKVKVGGHPIRHLFEKAMADSRATRREVQQLIDRDQRDRKDPGAGLHGPL